MRSRRAQVSKSSAALQLFIWENCKLRSRGDQGLYGQRIPGHTAPHFRGFGLRKGAVGLRGVLCGFVAPHFGDFGLRSQVRVGCLALLLLGFLDLLRRRD